jgi:hypothetical protein
LKSGSWKSCFTWEPTTMPNTWFQYLHRRVLGSVRLLLHTKLLFHAFL